MKKSFKRYLSLVMVLMVAFVCLFSVSVKAADSVYKTLIFNSTTMQTSISSYTASWKNKVDGDTWTIANANNNKKQWNYIKIGRKKNASVGYISTDFAMEPAISKIVVTVDALTVSKINSFKVYVATDSKFSNIVETVSATPAKGAVTFTVTNPVENAYYKIEADCASGSSNGLITISKVEYYASTTDPMISIKGNTNVMVGSFTQFTAVPSNVSGTPEWSSSNENIATVDQEGVVTPVSQGTAVISAVIGDVEGIIEIKVFPNNSVELTIAEAIEICEFTGETDTPYNYVTTGKVKTIDTAYDAGYGNITVTITDGVSSIKVFRLKGGSDLKVGDKIKVTGPLVNYKSNTPEFNQGCTYELIVDPIDAIVEQLNNVESYMSLAYTYTPVEGEEGVYDSVFRIRCGIDFAIADIEGVESYGIKVATSDKEKEYDETSEFWAEDTESEEQCYYVVIDLGNLFAEDEKFEIEFTVSAYVVVDGEIYYSEFEKSFSVATLVKEYYENKGVTEVEHLYNLLVERGIIKKEELQ